MSILLELMETVGGDGANCFDDGGIWEKRKIRGMIRSISCLVRKMRRKWLLYVKAQLKVVVERTMR